MRSFFKILPILAVVLVLNHCSGALRDQIVEASCGQCNLGLKKEGCDLAIRHKGKAYFVKGTGIDDHGDAHAEDGFCQRIRKARVSGRFEEGYFVADSFELLPLESS